jgi:hypothetical protein
MFFRGSRYTDVETLAFTDRDGRTFKYKAVRRIPETVARQAHRVQRGERLDHISYRYFRDPERFWRIADANGVMWPDHLVEEPGALILIPASAE